MESGQEILSFIGDNGISQIAVLLNGQRVITSPDFNGTGGIDDGFVWDIDYVGHKVTSSGVVEEVRTIAASSSGELFATYGRLLTIHDALTLETLRVVPPSVGYEPNWTLILDLVFSPDDQFLAAVTDNGKLLIVTVETGYLAASYQVAETALVDLNWSADGTRIAVTAGDGIVFLYSMPTS